MWSRTDAHFIAAPIDRVWQVVGDPTKLPRWHHYFHSVIDHDPGAESGTGRYRPTGFGKAVHERTAGPMEILRRGNRLIRLSQPQPGGTHVMEWRLDEVAAGADTPPGTVLTQHTSVFGVGSVGFTEVSARPFSHDFADNIARLALLVEPDRPADPLKVVIAGGTGFLGRRLAADLTTRGHDVVILTRNPDQSLPWRQARWDGRTVGAWASELDGDNVAVVNLAGKLVDCPPTDDNIAELVTSRVDPTRALVQASANRPVRRWLQASTTAGYADAGDERIDESTPLPTGKDALPQMTGVVVPWENAATGADGGAPANTEAMTIIRTSIVLAQDCPAFDRLTMISRFGAGGTVGPGDQWFSWIHLSDWLRIARAALGLRSPRLGAPATSPTIVNAAAPKPVRNSELMALLRRHYGPKVPLLGRLGIPTPAPLLKIGAVALRTDPALALTGRHCTSALLEQLDFTFSHPRLPEALQEIVN